MAFQQVHSPVTMLDTGDGESVRCMQKMGECRDQLVAVVKDASGDQSYYLEALYVCKRLG